MTKNPLLKGRVCVITGASGALGTATTERFLTEGATVVAVDRVPPPLLSTPDLIPEIIPEIGDISHRDFAEAVALRHPRADILVTYAAISPGLGFAEMDGAAWDVVLRTNVTAVAQWIKVFLPGMRASGRGSIVTVGSQLAIAGGRGNPAYFASKGAVMALTRSVALDYGTDGVRCNCLVPGAIESPLLHRAFARNENPAKAKSASRARHALGRFGQPSEIAAAALFLASDESSFVTGTALAVDGGWLAA